MITTLSVIPRSASRIMVLPVRAEARHTILRVSSPGTYSRMP